MKKLTESVIHNAMFSSIEGYVFSVVDSLEFELGRKLSDEEQNDVYQLIQKEITRVTCQGAAS